MPEISNQTFVMAIRAVASETRELREALASGVAESEEYPLLEDLIQAPGI